MSLLKYSLSVVGMIGSHSTPSVPARQWKPRRRISAAPATLRAVVAGRRQCSHGTLMRTRKRKQWMRWRHQCCLRRSHHPSSFRNQSRNQSHRLSPRRASYSDSTRYPKNLRYYHAYSHRWRRRRSDRCRRCESRSAAPGVRPAAESRGGRRAGSRARIARGSGDRDARQ